MTQKTVRNNRGICLTRYPTPSLFPCERLAPAPPVQPLTSLSHCLFALLLFAGFSRCIVRLQSTALRSGWTSWHEVSISSRTALGRPARFFSPFSSADDEQIIDLFQWECYTLPMWIYVFIHGCATIQDHLSSSQHVFCFDRETDARFWLFFCCFPSCSDLPLAMSLDPADLGFHSTSSCTR